MAIADDDALNILRTSRVLDAKAKYDLAISFKLRASYPRDHPMYLASATTLAAHWFEEAANEGNANAQCEFAICLQHGYGVERDSKGSISWLQTAIENRNGKAMFVLGMRYYSGDDMITCNKPYGLELIRSAARHGSFDADAFLNIIGEARAISTECKHEIGHVAVRKPILDIGKSDEPALPEDDEVLEKQADSDTCVVCLHNRVQVAPQECHHLCLCFACARAILNSTKKECPMCRAQIKEKMFRVFH